MLRLRCYDSVAASPGLAAAWLCASPAAAAERPPTEAGVVAQIQDCQRLPDEARYLDFILGANLGYRLR